jgi:iron only hydrogenase large subunit-like protein
VFTVLFFGRPQDVYHASVMPCYDKKLEASRQDFYNETYSTRDVDCVITTGELELMMREKEWDLSLPHELDDTLSSSSFDLPELLQHTGSSSGSYLQSIVSHLIASSSMSLQLSVKTLRNADYEDYVLTEVGSGKIVFKGAKCYGFRNLQNVVRKVGRERGVRVTGGAAGKLGGRVVVGKKNQYIGRSYDYIEVMACPGGCVNGGGQLKVPASAAGATKDAEGYSRNWEDQGVAEEGMPGARWGDKEWTRRVEEAYWHDRTFESLSAPATPSSDGTGCPTESSVELADQLTEIVHRELCTKERKGGNMLRTQYRAVESEVVGVAVKW